MQREIERIKKSFRNSFNLLIKYLDCDNKSPDKYWQELAKECCNYKLDDELSIDLLLAVVDYLEKREGKHEPIIGVAKIHIGNDYNFSSNHRTR